MAKRYIVPNPDGTIAVGQVIGPDADGLKLTKILFEISRTIDRTVHFDSAVHTREAIATGISGHRALPLLGECEDTDLPTDRYFRNAWEWSD